MGILQQLEMPPSVRLHMEIPWLVMVLVELGGAASEAVDVASSSFPSVKNQGLIEHVGL